MIKAILFILLAQNSDGQVMYANGFPVDSCKPAVVEAMLKSLPEVPRGLRLEYTCIEPGPLPVETRND